MATFDREGLEAARLTDATLAELHAPSVGIDACVLDNREGLDVGRFVGLFCQPTSGFWRSVAVASRATKSAESPVNKGNPRQGRDAGGGTRTPDTRIMIPLL